MKTAAKFLVILGLVSGPVCFATGKQYYMGKITTVSNPSGLCGASPYGMMFAGYNGQGQLTAPCFDKVDQNLTAVKCLLPSSPARGVARIKAILTRASQYPWAVITADESELVSDVIVDCRVKLAASK